jgi:hypothetical protein
VDASSNIALGSVIVSVIALGVSIWTRVDGRTSQRREERTTVYRTIYQVIQYRRAERMAEQVNRKYLYYHGNEGTPPKMPLPKERDEEPLDFDLQRVSSGEVRVALAVANTAHLEWDARAREFQGNYEANQHREPAQKTDLNELSGNVGAAGEAAARAEERLLHLMHAEVAM